MAVKSTMFAFERATKRTYRLKELAEEGKEIIGVLYVQKSTFDNKEPKKVKVTLEVIE